MAGTSIEISEEAGVRYLHFSSDWVQGAMRIRRPNALELAYTREMMAGLLLRPEAPWPRQVLLIGLGAGSLTKFIYHNLPQTRITVVEISPQVLIAAKQYFKLPDDAERLHVIVGDGAAYMRDSDARFDYILVDGFDKNARAGALDTLPFYQACRERLSADGLLAVNLLGRSRGFQASVGRIKEAFDGRALALPSCDSGNTIAFAAAASPATTSLDELRQRAGLLKKDTGLDLAPTITRLQAANTLPGGIIEI